MVIAMLALFESSLGLSGISVVIVLAALLLFGFLILVSRGGS